MAKEDSLEVEGKVIERLRNSRFRVELEGGHTVLAYLSGKMRQHFIRIIEGDKVRLSMSPYDLTQARIVYRGHFGELPGFEPTPAAATA